MNKIYLKKKKLGMCKRRKGYPIVRSGEGSEMSQSYSSGRATIQQSPVVLNTSWGRWTHWEGMRTGKSCYSSQDRTFSTIETLSTNIVLVENHRVITWLFFFFKAMWEFWDLFIHSITISQASIICQAPC